MLSARSTTALESCCEQSLLMPVCLPWAVLAAGLGKGLAKVLQVDVKYSSRLAGQVVRRFALSQRVYSLAFHPEEGSTVLQIRQVSNRPGWDVIRGVMHHSLTGSHQHSVQRNST